MIADEDLYNRYLDGDESGLTELMNRYGSSLTFYIYCYIHNINDAEDLMIDAFAYLIVKKPRIREGCLKAYLYKSARNLALRFVVKKRLFHCFSFEEIEKEPESKTPIEEFVQMQERDRTLYQCMEKLNPSYRQALYLVYFQNMRHAEAAEVMGKSEKQVSDLVFRGRKSLRKYLEQEGITDAEYG